MTPELATLDLYQPLAQGDGFLEDVSRYGWPSYRRMSLANGGDAVASFTFSERDAILEEWFDSRLACHFVEHHHGVATYMGLVWAMRLAYNGVVLSKSLDQLYNRIAIRYQTNSAGAETVTTFAENTESINLYGTRELVEDAPAYINSTTAAAYRSNLLSRLGLPKQRQESVQAGNRQPGTLQVEIRGYAATLDGKLLKNTSIADDDADDEVQDALSGADFVTAGSIAINTLQVKEEVDYEGAWQRIKAIAKLGDGGGDLWLAGCYAGRTLDYYQADIATVQYFLEVQNRPFGFVVYDAAGEYIPAPVVQPGGVAFVRDIMPGRAVNATLLDDPRAIFVNSVEYSADGVVLKDAEGQDVRYAALQMALALKLDVGKD